MQEKSAARGMAALTDAEHDVLAIEALEREVNNGGYSQFFVNGSLEFVPTVVAACSRISRRIAIS